jgi:hypothetical protein
MISNRCGVPHTSISARLLRTYATESARSKWPGSRGAASRHSGSRGASLVFAIVAEDSGHLIVRLCEFVSARASRLVRRFGPAGRAGDVPGAAGRLGAHRRHGIAASRFGCRRHGHRGGDDYYRQAPPLRTPRCGSVRDGAHPSCRTGAGELVEMRKASALLAQRSALCSELPSRTPASRPRSTRTRPGVVSGHGTHFD